MKIAFALMIMLALCLAASAQPVVVGSGSDRFQSVSGDFGRAWINNFLAQNPKPVTQDNKSGLWSWGNIPKGKILVGGQLRDATNSTKVNNTNADWLGNYYVDPYTGRPIYESYPVFSNPMFSNNQQYLQLPEFVQSAETVLDPWQI